MLRSRERLSLTARWTAAERAVESRRADRLFDDPYAEALARPDGFALMERMELAARPPGRARQLENPQLAIRTRFFDDFLRDALAASGSRQVVLLAAGFDTRAFRLEWPQGTRLFELDRPELLDDKRAVLHDLGAQARCDRTVVGVDLESDWTGSLRAAGFVPSERSAWLVEGLLAYLNEVVVEHLLVLIRSVACNESRLAADFIGQRFFTSPWTREFTAALKLEGVPWEFGTDDPEELLARHGWAATARQPGDDGASYGRWPFGVRPRGSAGSPMNYLVTAIAIDGSAFGRYERQP
jgi:methyltransferase (TIGR00027 family)